MAPPESLLESGSNQKTDQVQLNFPLPKAANSAALEAGSREVSVPLWREDPILHTQPVFKYQQKCLNRIRASHAALPPPAKERARELFDGTGCDKFFE